MDPLIATAASGMRSRMQTLDLLANNIANTSTSGYKADQESYNLYFGDDAWDAFNEGRPPTNEMPVIQQSWTDLAQGTLLETASPYDVALASSGFFVVTTSGGQLFTRNGHFRISKNGRLETHDGFAVQSKGGGEIVIDPALPFQIAKNGDITQTGNTVAQLRVVTVDQADGLTKQSGAYFQLTPAAKASELDDPEIQQGRLESSNVPPAQAAVKLVSVMRQFEMLQKAVLLASQMNQRTFGEVAKVPS
ncbi:MAG: flagellar hook basal-body protein [Bryobacteraceae bacterium]